MFLGLSNQEGLDGRHIWHVWGRGEVHTGVLVRKPEGKRPLGRPRLSWEDNIKIYLQEIGWGVVDWIDLAQDRNKLRVFVNTVRKFRFP
jgi:hypothetical protein